MTVGLVFGREEHWLALCIQSGRDKSYMPTFQQQYGSVTNLWVIGLLGGTVTVIYFIFTNDFCFLPFSDWSDVTARIYLSIYSLLIYKVDINVDMSRKINIFINSTLLVNLIIYVLLLLAVIRISPMVDRNYFDVYSCKSCSYQMTRHF